MEFITDNPFYYDSKESTTAHWVLLHEKEVKRTIYYAFEEMTHKYNNDEVAELYDYLINYFIVNPNKEFDKDFKVKQDLYQLDVDDYDQESLEKKIEESKERSKTYNMKNYVLHMAKQIARGHVKNFLNKDRENSRIVSQGESYESTCSGNIISSSVVVDSMKMSDHSTFDSPEDIIDFSHLNEIYDELHMYDPELYEKGLPNNITLQDFIYNYFIDGSVTDEKQIAKKLGVTPISLTQYKSGLKMILKEEVDEYSDLVESINDLVHAVAHRCWEPNLV